MGSLWVEAIVLVLIGALETVAVQVRGVRLGFAGLAFAEPIDPGEARSKVVVQASGIGERDSTNPRIVSPGATAGQAEDVKDLYRR